MKPPRTVLLVPGHDRAAVAGALLSDADAVILDLEDLVPPSAKDEARDSVLRASTEPRRPGLALGVRVNGPSSRRFLDDVRVLVETMLDFTLIPHVTGLADAQFATKYFNVIGRLDGPDHDLLMTVETPGCLVELTNIVNANLPLSGLIVGSNDYLTEIGRTSSASPRSTQVDPAGFDALAHLRGLMLATARAHRLIAIDTVPQSAMTTDEWTTQICRSRAMGFDGCTVRTVEQVSLANEIFTRTAEADQ